MKIKKNDIVKILAGKDKGKTGKVLRCYPETQKIVVEGIAVIAKHMRAGRNGEKGQKIYLPKAFAVSKAMIVCPKCGQGTRIGYQAVPHQTGVVSKIKKERVCKKCHQSFTS